MENLKIILIAVGLGIVAIIFMIIFSVTFNNSESAPNGLWVKSFEKWSVGDWVYLCPDERMQNELVKLKGDKKALFSGCTNNAARLVKKVVASCGDRVVVDDRNTIVNDVVVGTGLPNRNINLNIINCDEIFVLGLVNQSYDSRIFGLIENDLISSKAVLLWEIK